MPSDVRGVTIMSYISNPLREARFRRLGLGVPRMPFHEQRYREFPYSATTGDIYVRAVEQRDAEAETMIREAQF